LLGLWLLLW